MFRFKLEQGVLVLIVLSLLSFAFFLGRLYNTVTNLEKTVLKIEKSITELDQRIKYVETYNVCIENLCDNLIPSKKSTDGIVINDDLKDKQNNSIDKNQAPFIVKVTGKVSGAKNNYVYLVVKNINAEYVQPKGSLGINVDGNFSGYCYLGIENDRQSLGQSYTLSAVIVNREYGSHEILQRKTIIKESNKFELIRTR